MPKYILGRLVQSVPVVLVVTLLVFFLMHLVPGGPISIMAGPEISQQELERIKNQLGLDDPLPVQYLRWLGRALTGDLGLSVRARIPVADEISYRLVNTLRLASASVFVALLIGIPSGIMAAVKRGSVVDVSTMAFSTLGFSIPPFWLGLVLIIVFSVKLGWLPAGGGDTNRHLILPALSLGVSTSALISRMTRASLLEVLSLDYIRTARAKGVREQMVIIKHALRNSLVPIITVLAIQIGVLIGGAAVTEVVFSWPGIGSLLVSGILNRDFAIVQGALLVSSMFFIAANLAADVLYALLDPRMREY